MYMYVYLLKQSYKIESYKTVTVVFSLIKIKQVHSGKKVHHIYETVS